MKRILNIIVLAVLVASCGPTRHAIYLEMRHPSKSGIELAGKNVAVVHLENDNVFSNDLAKGIAVGLSKSLEQDYETGEGSVAVFSMRVAPGSRYASKDTLINLLIETGGDVLFLIDTLNVGTLTMGGTTSVASPESPDSTYISTGNLPFKMRLYCFDAMNKDEKVFSYSGSSTAVPYAYSDGRQSDEVIKERAMKSLPLLGYEAGRTISSNFKSQWVSEQYSVLYFDGEKWYKALEYADALMWKPAMEIWLELVYTNDLMKRSSAAYNLALASYMLGDYDLATEWLDMSDKDNKLPISDSLRKRIDARK